MSEVIRLFSDYGAETVALAAIICALTEFLKIPLKKAGGKNNKSFTERIIVFIPFSVGLVLTFLYFKIARPDLSNKKNFIELWLTASSLSLTFYAVVKKAFFVKRDGAGGEIKVLDGENEAKASGQSGVTNAEAEFCDLKTVRAKVDLNSSGEVVNSLNYENKKIILKGNREDET